MVLSVLVMATGGFLAYKALQEQQASNKTEPATAVIGGNGGAENVNPPAPQPTPSTENNKKEEDTAATETLDDDFKPNVPGPKKDRRFSEDTATELETLEAN